MVDKRPALIARCAGTAGASDAVSFATEQDLPISVKGGGHSIAGRTVEDDALMIDLEADGDQQAAYGENYDRLVAVKNAWDPENLFRLNHNVEPTEQS